MDASVAPSLVKGVLLAVLLIALLVSVVIWAISKRARRAASREIFERELDEFARRELAEFDFAKEKRDIESIARRYTSDTLTCPRCGGLLVERQGIYGRFLGCNRYPACRYTRGIE